MSLQVFRTPYLGAQQCSHQVELKQRHSRNIISRSSSGLFRPPYNFVVERSAHILYILGRYPDCQLHTPPGRSLGRWAVFSCSDNSSYTMTTLAFDLHPRLRRILRQIYGLISNKLFMSTCQLDFQKKILESPEINRKRKSDFRLTNWFSNKQNACTLSWQVMFSWYIL